MIPFKFIVGQDVKIKSKDRNLGGKVVRVVSRGTTEEHEPPENWYKVKGDGIHEYLSFFEDQLE